MIEPPVMNSGGLAISESIDNAVSDLPQPLSPTTASVSFGYSEMLTSRTMS